MSDNEAPSPSPAAPSAPEGDGGAALDNALHQVFGKEVAEAVGAKPLVRSDADDKPKADAAEEKPKPDVRVSKRLLAAQKAELRQAQSRKEMEAARAEIAREKEALKEIAALAEKAKLAKTSPSKLLELAGLKPKDFLEALATEHEPEAIARRVAEETKTETQELREQLEALKKERELEAERAKAEASKREWEQESRAFVEMVATKHEDFPHMQGLTERRVMSLVDEALHRVVSHDEHGRPVTENEAFFAETGRFPSNEEIAQFIEHTLAQEAGETLSARRARMGQNAPKPTPPDSRGHSPRTLPARAASSRAVASKDLSQEEMDELSLQILRQVSG